jgi:hypothetical protein
MAGVCGGAELSPYGREQKKKEEEWDPMISFKGKSPSDEKLPTRPHLPMVPC